DQPDRAALNQLNAGRFERLHESGGEPDRDAVLVPYLLSTAGVEAQQAGFGERLAVEARQQRFTSFIVTGDGARIDMTVAHPMLEWDPPGPAAPLRRRPGERRGRRSDLASHCD